MRMSQSFVAMDLKRAAESGIVGTNSGREKGGLATKGNARALKTPNKGPVRQGVTATDYHGELP